MAKKRGPDPSPARAGGVRPDARASESPTPADLPPAARRPTYVEALAAYEQGMNALQRRDYDAAAAAFRHLLSAYPRETEIQERARVYLNVCERHLQAPAPAPQTIPDRIYAATLAINGGRYDEAERVLASVIEEAPDHDHAYFMLAVARTGRGLSDGALAALTRAVALNPENRIVARHDPDLASLRVLPQFQRLVDGAGPGGRNGR